MTAPEVGPAGSPVPEAAAVELGRVADRWSVLPLPEAVALSPRVRQVAEGLAGRPLADLGPAVVLDQLRAVVWDTCAEAAGDGDVLARVAADLAALRRGLS